jgi:hypothetical protein
MKRILYPLLVLAIAAPCLADSLVYMRVPKPLVEEHVRQAKDAEAERVSALRKLFQKDGCPQVVEQTVAEEQSPNLICILPGLAEGTILVGASLGYATEDAKTPSHWSALALLPLLAKSLAGVPHRSTLILIAFPGRGHGTHGAVQYLSQITEAQRKTLRAVVDLDNLGQTPAVYTLAQPDKALSTWLLEAAHSLHLAAPPMVEAKSRDEDLEGNTQPFVKAGIPSISLRSAQPAVLAALKHDGAFPDSVTGDGFNLDIYDDTYRLLCIYVLYLDGNLGRPPIKLGTYTGTLVDTAGAYGPRISEISMTIDRFTTAAELERMETALKKGGQEGLIDALDRIADVGSYRVGLRLGTSAKLAVLQTTDKTPSVLLVAIRARVRATNPMNDYRFEVVQLNVNSKGDRDGKLFDKVKLGFNSTHELEIADHFSLADDIRQVHLETLPAAKAPSLMK